MMSLSCQETSMNQSTIMTEWHDNGIKAYEYTAVNGLKHGTEKQWYRNGFLSSETNYKNGTPHGLYTSFFPSGQVFILFSYYEGKLHGNYKQWTYDGELSVNKDYVMGYWKEKIMIILKYLRKAKLYRFARLVKTRPFIEWWYSPTGPGGRLHKESMKNFCESLINMP